MKYQILCVVLTLCSCESLPPPKTELCGGTSIGNLACNDQRRDNQDYTRELRKGDLCTNSKDFERMRGYCSDLRVELLKCRNNKSTK